MNWKKAILMVLLALSLVVSGGFEKDVQAEEKPMPIRKTPITDAGKLMSMGEKLWNDKTLGTSGNACATCHPDGKGLKKAPFPKYLKMPNDILTLDQMINFCMLNPMKGKPLPWNSEKITALAAYVQSHAKEEGEPAQPAR